MLTIRQYKIHCCISQTNAVQDDVVCCLQALEQQCGVPHKCVTGQAVVCRKVVMTEGETGGVGQGLHGLSRLLIRCKDIRSIYK